MEPQICCWLKKNEQIPLSTQAMWMEESFLLRYCILTAGQHWSAAAADLMKI